MVQFLQRMPSIPASASAFGWAREKRMSYLLAGHGGWVVRWG
jgi:hypothetical protein